MSNSEKGGSTPPPTNDTSASSHSSRKSSSVSDCSRRSAGPSNQSDLITIYRNPFYKSRSTTRRHGFNGDAGPPPPLRISSRRLQVFSYVLAELSSAATLLPDYTRAILNLSQKLIGAWQAITAAAIARTRYEHALIWAAYHDQQPQQRRTSPAAVSSRQEIVGGQTGPRGGAKRKGTSPPTSSSAPTTTRASEAFTNASPTTGSTITTTTTSAAAFPFDAAHPFASSSHKRRRLGNELENGNLNSAVSSRVHDARPSSALKLKRALYDRSRQATDESQGFGNLPLPPHVSSPAKRPLRAEKVRSRRGRHKLTSTTCPSLTLPLSGAPERRACQLAYRHREQVFWNTLHQLWLDAQEKEDKVGQYVEYLRGLIVNVLFQQYLGVTVEQSYHDLVLYRWLSPILVLVRDGALHGAAGSHSRSEEEAERNRNNNNDHRYKSNFSFSLSPVGELEHGGGGAGRRARRRQAATQVAQDVQLLRQMLRRAQITAVPTTECLPRRSGRKQRAVGSRTVSSSEAQLANSSSLSSSVSASSTSTFFDSSSLSSSGSKKRQRSPSAVAAAPPQTRLTTEGKEATQGAALAAAAEAVVPGTLASNRAIKEVTQRLSSDRNNNSLEKSNERQETPFAPPKQPTAEKEEKGAAEAHDTGISSTAAQADDENSSFYSTLHNTDRLPHERISPLLPGGATAMPLPLPLRLFLQACTSFDPTHCAFSLMSRCVILAQHVRSEDDEQAKPAHFVSSSSHERMSSDEQPARQIHRRSTSTADLDSTKGSECEGEEEVGEEAAEEFTGLFYVVIARRAVGPCGHTALCFGNHKFIFVRCRDTEALIREVLLSDDDEKDDGAQDENDQMYATLNPATGSCLKRRPDGMEPAWDKQTTNMYCTEGHGDDHQPCRSLSLAAGEEEEGSDEKKQALPHDEEFSTSSPCVTVNTGPQNNAKNSRRQQQSKVTTMGSAHRIEHPAMANFAPPLASLAPRPHAGITALTERDARRLQRNSSVDNGALRAPSKAAGSTPTTAMTTIADTASTVLHLDKRAGVFQLPSNASLSNSNYRDVTCTHPHVTPVLQPPLPSAARMDSTISSGASSSVPAANAAAAAARRWNRHMRQAAWAGPRALPPPFVSADALDLQLNSGFSESVLMLPLPVPPVRTPRTAGTQDILPQRPSSIPLEGLESTAVPSPRSPLTADGNSSQQEFVPLPPPAPSTLSRPSSNTHASFVASPSPMKSFYSSDTVDASLRASMHSPLHLTPLAFHTRLHPGSSDRARAPPPPLELTPQTQSQVQAQRSTCKVHMLPIEELTVKKIEDEGALATSLFRTPADATAVLFNGCEPSPADSPGATDIDAPQRFTMTDEHEDKDCAADIEGEDEQPPYVVMHSVLCSCMSSVSEDVNSNNSIVNGSNADRVNSTAPAVPDDSVPASVPSSIPRESAFPSSLRTTEAPGVLDGSGYNAQDAAVIYEDLPLSYFEQQVLLSPSSGQECRFSSDNKNNSNNNCYKSSQLRLTSGFSAPQNTPAQVTAASHLFHVVDRLQAAASPVAVAGSGSQKSTFEAKSNEDVDGGQQGNARTTHTVAGGTSAGNEQKSGREVKYASGLSHIRAFVSPGHDNSGGFAEEVRQQQQQTSYSSAKNASRIYDGDEPSPTCLSFPSSVPSSPVEPTEGDMAFAAELYSRLEFWSLRGQDRSEYIDPSWLLKEKAGKQYAAEAHAEEEEVKPTHSLNPQQQREERGSGAGDDVSSLPKNRSSSSHSDKCSDTPPGLDDDEKGGKVHEANGMMRLPLKLLDYVAGTIELVDDAFLTAQQRKSRASKTAATGTSQKKKTAGEEQLKNEEENRKLGDSDSQNSNTAHKDVDDEETEGEEEEEGEQHGSFPYFTPLMTVNARGKELLFEALHEATEVVVCAVRESRAHAGYHDLLHQRCPPRLSPSSPSTAAALDSPPITTATSACGGTSNKNGCGNNISALQSASPIVGTDTLTKVNTWALTVATAASQGCTFPIATGTLSHDERCPFTFDRHQHLGTYGIVQWSQGNAAVAERDCGGGSGSGVVCESSGVADVSEGSLSFLPAPLSTSRSSSSTVHENRSSAYTVSSGSVDSKQLDSNAGLKIQSKQNADQRGTENTANSPSPSSFTPQSHTWRWPALPANDEKQWRCELLKSEFRLARSRCLDALLVDHVHGRPIAAITLEPRTWTQVRGEAQPSPSLQTFTSRGGQNGCATGGNKKNDSNAATTAAKATGFGSVEVRQEESPLPFYLPTSTQEVVQRTVYVVTSFTHYVAPLWRHLHEEKAVLVDMDRTLVDNVITVRTSAERQRHLVHVNRAMAAAGGKPGAVNPCVLWRPQQLRCRPSSARFGAPPFQLGRNDALPLSCEEVLCDEGDSLSATHVLCTEDNSASVLERSAGIHSAPTDPRTAPSEQQKRRVGLLYAFLDRTAVQREDLGTLHYEECGAVTYVAGALYTSGKPGDDHKQSETPSDARKDRVKTQGGASFSASPKAKGASECTGAYSDLVYVRPGVRQFLYRTAVQWNIPLVLVTKSTRSRAEAIVHNVLDPHGILFPDPQSCVVTADEMLTALPTMEHSGLVDVTQAGGAFHQDKSSKLNATTADWTKQQHFLPGERASSPITTTPTTRNAIIAERIARCHKSTLRVLQSALDAAALRSSRQAWRAPPWCDLLMRLPKPRSIAVLDDAPQVWEERDWPCTVNIVPYTLARVDPMSYFSPHGFMSALVLSCLYGSKCLVCSAGELYVGAGTAAATASSGHGSQRGTRLRADGGNLRSPLKEESHIGLERWPHCICVCPSDHQDEILSAAGARGEPFTPFANDAAATVRSMIADLVWRSAASSASRSFSSGMLNSALLHRLQPLLLPTVGVEESVVEEGPNSRSSKSASARRFAKKRYANGKINCANAVCENLNDQLFSPGRKSSGDNTSRSRSGRDGFHVPTSSFIEDVQPLPHPQQGEPSSSASSDNSSVKQLEHTFTTQEVHEMAPEPSATTTTATAATNVPFTRPSQFDVHDAHDQQDLNNQHSNSGVSAHSPSALAANSTSRASTSSTASSLSYGSTTTSTSSSSSSLVSPVSFSGDASRDVNDSLYSIPVGAGVGSSMPATPTSFTALPDAWSHTGPLVDNSGFNSCSNTAVAAAATTPPSAAIMRGVVDVVTNASEEVESEVGMAINDSSNRGSGQGYAFQPPSLGANEEETEKESNTDAKSYEDVEPIEFADTRRGMAGVEDVTAMAQCAPTTATRGGAGGRSSSSNTEVEDVVPLEAQQMPTASTYNNNAKDTHFSVAGSYNERENEGYKKTSPTSTEMCTGELRRPQRRRLDNPRDDVEDVVPL